MFWEHATFLDPAVEGPPALIPAQAIISQACRVTLRQLTTTTATVSTADSTSSIDSEDEDPSRGRETRIWATIGLTRVRGSGHRIAF